MTRYALNSDLLLKAYSLGVFPMSESRDDPAIFWVDPRHRGIIPLDGFHISRSLARRLRRGAFDVTADRDFIGTVRACADRPETWINDTIFDLYCELYDLGHAHSLEVWVEGELAGGVYGVTLGAAFFGESMFSRRSDASKIALAYLTDHLRRSGFMLFDTQFITPHLRSLGGVEIARDAYHKLLDVAVERVADFNTGQPLGTGQDILQRNTQTS